MIRPARPADVPEVHRLIPELADYERVPLPSPASPTPSTAPPR